MQGLMIQAPVGSGKSYYINHYIPSNYKDIVLDGDDLLRSLNIKNRHYFWYTEGKEQEQKKIINTFNNYLKKGYIIFYSGNPVLIKTDILIIPDKNKRWNQLHQRNEYIPPNELFFKEQYTYETEAINVPFCVNGDIPSFDLIQSMHKELKY